VFNLQDPLPSAIGMSEQVQAAGLTKEDAEQLLRWSTRRREYAAALNGGGSRYDLDGSAAGKVSADHRDTPVPPIRHAASVSQ
jgi:sRNA-binding protein